MTLYKYNISLIVGNDKKLFTAFRLTSSWSNQMFSVTFLFIVWSLLSCSFVLSALLDLPFTFKLQVSPYTENSKKMNNGIDNKVQYSCIYK